MAAPTVIVREQHQYTLYYRQGNNPHPQQLTFMLNSPKLQDAVRRAQRHCEVMNYRFVSVKPTVVDLDREENFLLNRE